MIRKAKLIRYIPLETTAIFFLSNFDLKQGIGYVYVMVDFIGMGYLGLQGAKTENYKMKNTSQRRNRTHDPWITSLVYNLLGHQIWYIIDNLKPNQ